MAGKTDIKAKNSDTVCMCVCVSLCTGTELLAFQDAQELFLSLASAMGREQSKYCACILAHTCMRMQVQAMRKLKGLQVHVPWLTPICASRHKPPTSPTNNVE